MPPPLRRWARGWGGRGAAARRAESFGGGRGGGAGGRRAAAAEAAAAEAEPAAAAEAAAAKAAAAESRRSVGAAWAAEQPARFVATVALPPPGRRHGRAPAGEEGRTEGRTGTAPDGPDPTVTAHVEGVGGSRPGRGPQGGWTPSPRAAPPSGPRA
jgi:hypothetical protein